jgi:dihydroanticapsin dehydrogenase
MDLALDGKAALVTGGASGIGLACMEALAREGARALSLDRNAAADLQADVTDEGQVRSAVDAAVHALGGLDILVCCAGISGPVGRSRRQCAPPTGMP